MSAREQNKKSAIESGAGARGLYVYCVGERAELAPLFAAALPAAIEPDAPLEMIAAADLCAVVSAVPLADYDEATLPGRLADATWTAVRAMRHERVVEHFARRAGIVPLRFGTIYLARVNVERMLVERGAELQAIVARLRGHEEWGVNVYCDRVRLLAEIVTVSPRLRELTAQAASATPGQAYLLKKKVETLRTDEARADVKRVAGAVEQALMQTCAGAARLRVLKDEASEHGDAVAKFAFLVARARFDEFRATAERLADEHAVAGYKLELTGPWPAYNFAGAA